MLPSENNSRRALPGILASAENQVAAEAFEGLGAVDELLVRRESSVLNAALSFQGKS